MAQRCYFLTASIYEIDPTYPKQTRKPSKTLKPSLMYWINPKAVIFTSISIVKIKLKTRLLISTILESVAG